MVANSLRIHLSEDINHLRIDLQEKDFRHAPRHAKRLLAAAPKGAQFIRLPIPASFLLGDCGYVHEHVRILRGWDPMHDRKIGRLDIEWEPLDVC